MTTINRVRVGWSGFVGAPGVSTFYFGSATVDMTALKAFFNSISTWTPSNVLFTIPTLADQINDTDGKITGSVALTNGGTVTSVGGTTGYAGSAGLCVDWLTSAIIAGHRVQGRTFIVPTAVAAFQNDGTISEGVRTSVTTAGLTLITAYAGEMKIWARPFAGKPQIGTPGNPGYRPARPARVGAATQVIAAKVPDIAAVRRSRRS